MELKEKLIKFPVTHFIFFLKNLKHVLINCFTQREKKDLITASS